MPEVAEACAGLYDSWVVLTDDRTVDDTALAAGEHLEGPGAVHPFTFEDFSQARNLLLEQARIGLDPEEDFILLADPDSPPRGVLPGLARDWYSCTWRQGQTEWQMPVLIRAGVECHYEGAAHEILRLPATATSAPAEELLVVVAPKAFSSERFELYLELLLPDATENPRSAFYLARTYADLQRRGEAIEAYLRRAQMGHGVIEETYLSVLNAGILLVPLDVELARVLLERARRLRPGRVETLYHLAWLANATSDPERAAGYCAEAVQMPPSSDGLFVNRWAEREGILFELGKALDAMRADNPPTLEEQ